MKALPLIVFATLIAFTSVYAEPPEELEGMKKIKQWTDTENKHDEMPEFIWGDYEVSNMIGLYVEFANGLVGSVTYDNLIKANIWNKPTGIPRPWVHT